MRIAITGSTGLIGGHLAASLRDDGHTALPVVRDRPRAGQEGIYWSPARGEIDTGAFAGLDAVVHLAGEPLGRRWTREQKRRIFDSRVEGTGLLASALADLDDPPGVLISASAVGYYGNRGEEILTEESGPGEGFLADVCAAWESAADPARRAGLRVVHPRTGVVIASEGPLMDKALLPFKLGLGGRIGSGRQWYPWIALEDQIRGLRHLLEDDSLVGPVNLTAPEPVRNAEFTRAFAAALHRPAIFPIPPLALALLYGEGGRVLATWSQRVVPERLLQAGFSHHHQSIEEAFQAALAG